MGKVKAVHDRTGFIGQITDEAAYEGVKAGTLDWKPHVKAKMESIQIPEPVLQAHGAGQERR